MEKLHLQEIKSRLTAFEIYSVFKDEEYSFILDSGMDSEKLGRYSFVGFNPFLVFKSKNGVVDIVDGENPIRHEGNPFVILKQLLGKYRVENKTGLPFIGGAVGYFGYDLCHHIEKLPRKAVDDVNIPDCFFGFYDNIIVIDHVNGRIYLVSPGMTKRGEKNIGHIAERIRKAEAEGVRLPSLTDGGGRTELKSNFTKQEYIEALIKLKKYIENGDIYQANLTQRFQCKITEKPFNIYRRLRAVNPAPFATYLDFKDGCILSSSPERFIRIRDRKIETRPIKGTRPRGKTEEEDAANREELLSSEKDKAELLMIVDLERNDLGKVSKAGSVKVTELFRLEAYATVYHLVATVTGILKDQYDEMDCIMAAFPGGSITGAPKIRAIEIIDELEPTQRNVYTGCIGYLGFDGSVDLNIVIRTILIKDKTAYFQVGGGIVWDSDPEEEYQETLHKGRALIKALQGSI